MRSTELQLRETQLTDRAARGDGIAFHQLVDEHAAYLYRTSHAMLCSQSDAEDVVQETLLAAYQHIGRFAGRSSFRTWLVKILMNQVALRRRKHKPVMRMADDAEPRHPQTPSAAQAVDAKLDVQRMLQDLSTEHREVLVLRECEGMSYDQIAEALDVPRGTVESRLFRARQELRKRFGEYL